LAKSGRTRHESRANPFPDRKRRIRESIAEGITTGTGKISVSYASLFSAEKMAFAQRRPVDS
jgi:hypothetical protein